MISTNSTDMLIEAALDYVYINHEELSKNKFAGVHNVDHGKYTVHVSAFIPKMISASDLNASISAVIESRFAHSMTWDKQTMWLTIKLQ